jgi:hypothetical protein
VSGPGPDRPTAVAHICRLPSVHGEAEHFRCPRCGWLWDLNPIVLKWFRRAPASVIGTWDVAANGDFSRGLLPKARP